MYKKMIFSKEEVSTLANADTKIKRLIETVGVVEREYIVDNFTALVQSVIYQQISFKAANSIWNKFILYIDEITPNNINDAKVDGLRDCGLSKTKINYIKNIAISVTNKEINFINYPSMTNKDIVDELIKVKGIGPWTAEMFLIFSLVRKDIINYKDLGIRKGIQWLYGLKEELTEKQFEKYRKVYSPNETLASLYLWEITIQNYFQYNSIDDCIQNKRK